MKRRLHFSGPVLTASGYGTHARQLLRALIDSDLFDVRVESLRWGETPFLTGPDVQWISDLVVPSTEGMSFDVSIQVTIPNEFRRRAPLTIGVTAGIEVDRVSPQWIMRCNQEVDAVIVPSEHSRAAFGVEYQGPNGDRLRLEKALIVVPEGVDTTVYRPDAVLSPILDRADVPAKNFIFVGLGLDRADGRDRKNVTRLIELFCRTFKNVRGIGLILKVAIVNGSTVDFELVKRRVSEIKAGVGCGEFPRITVIHGRLDERDLADMYNDQRVIAAISLTHGEGFGLPLIEAAACGLPVMATDWSGHLDFLTVDGRKLFVPLEHDLVQIPPECVWEGVMEQGTMWANVREADVMTKMQKMVVSSITPRRWAEELGRHIAERYSLPVTAERFMTVVRQGLKELDSVRAPTDALVEMRRTVREKGPSLVYTMPMSAGDVFLSTGVISALRGKHPGHRVYLATSPQYFDIVRDLHTADGSLLVDELIDWQQWMQSPEALERVFDVAYTPNLNVQHTWANWIHGGMGRHLLDELAAQCDVDADDPVLPEQQRGMIIRPSDLVGDGAWLAVHAGGQKSARLYSHWSDIVRNIRRGGVKVVQVGAKDDVGIGEVDLDLRGRTGHADLVETLRCCVTFVGIDSYPMHVADSVGIPVVSLFGSSYPRSTGPKAHRLLHVIETPDRNGCERACYKDVCAVDSSNPCINNIDPATVFARLTEVLSGLDITLGDFERHRPRISGYTHVLNPKTHGYPYIQSIRSMLGFCDEVIVVNGDPSDSDGSIGDLRGFDGCSQAIVSGQLKIIDRAWDPEEPGMDGMQKAFGRAMVSPDAEFLWQQDADEVVHEDDYGRIVDICRRFPSDVDVVHLPVIELWGDDRHVRTDRHSWKWRLSRNNLRVTHGIALAARQLDQRTGRIYAKHGMSDGCEMIDMVTGEHLPHRGFYSKELEELRLRDPVSYGRTMNGVFARLPSVWHYSWADLPRKIRNFRDFWDRQWQTIYQRPPEPRFPDVTSDEDVVRKAEELKERGGEHGAAPTFTIDRKPPIVMRGWLDLGEPMQRFDTKNQNGRIYPETVLRREFDR